MNETTRELDLIRAHLRTAIEHDLHGRTRRLRVTHRLRLRLAIPTLAVLAAATAAIVIGFTVSAASPSSASAAARRALAATAAAPSGTMTTTVLHGGVTQTVDAARWNGNDIAFSTGFDQFPQLLLIGGGVYVQTSDGSWLHYANASDVGPKPLGGLEQLAQDQIAAPPRSRSSPSPPTCKRRRKRTAPRSTPARSPTAASIQRSSPAMTRSRT